jgi:hypothetical protein
MARKLTGGLSGGPNIGAINVDSAAVITAPSARDITLSPAGGGAVVITSNAVLNAQSDLRFADSDSSNYVAFQAPATIASNITWTLPAVIGTNGQVFTADGSGNIEWNTPQVSIVNNTVDATLYNLSFTTASSGLVANLTTDNAKLRYQPSTGTVYSGVVSGGTDASVSLTLRSTSNASKGSVIIDETTASTTTTTGALQVGGGVGIAGNLNVGGSISTAIGASGILNYGIILTTTALENVDKYYLTIGGSYTVTLPASPTNGRFIAIRDGSNIWASSNITVGRNGKTIGGLNEDLVLNANNALIFLIFYNNNWQVSVVSS